MKLFTARQKDREKTGQTENTHFTVPIKQADIDCC